MTGQNNGTEVVFFTRAATAALLRPYVEPRFGVTRRSRGSSSRRLGIALTHWNGLVVQYRAIPDQTLAIARSLMSRPGKLERSWTAQRIPVTKWRERMGIEPTRSLFPDPSPVLKTGQSTSY
jgi:hypothetical protein